MEPFYPSASVTKDASTSSAAYSIPGGLTSDEKTVRVVREDNSSRVFIKFGEKQDLTVSTTDGMELIAGVVEVFQMPRTFNFFAIVCDTGNVEVNVTSGQGV